MVAGHRESKQNPRSHSVLGLAHVCARMRTYAHVSARVRMRVRAPALLFSSPQPHGHDKNSGCRCHPKAAERNDAPRFFKIFTR